MQITSIILILLFVSCNYGLDVEALKPKPKDPVKPTSYTVTFNANGGLPVPAMQTIEIDGLAVMPSPGPAKINYDFAGWYKEEGLVNKWNFSNDTVNADIVLYARWIEKGTGYSVVFYENGGKPEPESPIVVGFDEKLDEPEIMTKEYNSFGGWFTDEEFNNPWNFDTDTVTNHLSLYAKWTLVLRAVAFNADGGTPAPSPVTVSHGHKLTEPASMTKEDLLFGGWYRQAAFTVEWDFENDTVTGNMTLYAMWGLPRTLTFNADGGTPAPAELTVANGVKIKEPTAMEKTGYLFDAWYKEAAFTNKWIFASDTVTSNTTVSAKWYPITYTVTYNSNHAEATGQTENSEHTYDVYNNLTANNFFRTGYTFAGWAKTPGGDVEFTNSESIKNLSSTQGAEVELFAKWTINSYTFTFNTNGGTPVPEAQTITHGSLAVRPNSNPALSDHVFDNWYSNEELTILYNFASAVTVDTEIFAGWIPPSYITITFNQISDEAPEIIGPTIYRSGENGQTTATITLENHEQYSNIEWRILRTGIIVNGPAIILDSSNTAYNNVGEHSLTVEVIKDGVPYNTTVIFTVMP